QIEPHLVADFVAHSANPTELAYFAANFQDSAPVVLETLIRRRDVPRNLLVAMAPRLPVVYQDILILRQDAIVEAPAILDALEANPDLERSIKRRILEYREHLIPRARRILQELAPGESGEPANGEIIEAILEADSAPPSGELEEVTGLTEGQIRLLAIPVRLRLSRGAPRTLRNMLIKDPHPQVAVSTLVNNALSDDELEMAARSRVVVEDILIEMARHREWMNKHSVVSALVGNPRTPIAIAMRHLPRLSVRELRSLAHNRNVSDAVRKAAQRQFQAKTS
nr:hypothetical protein [Thermoanaerobaculia bacterium]